MSEPEYVIVHNECEVSVTVFLRWRRKLKARKPRIWSFLLTPGEASEVVPKHALIGAKGWVRLRELECVRFETVAWEARFARVTNRSKETVELVINTRPEKGKTQQIKVPVKPGRRSRIVDLKSVSKKTKLGKLEEEGLVTVKPEYDIGPPPRRGPGVASYLGERVYICDKCGGPIVFRGYPPRPIHI